jgi:ubiquinone/menaquinone biosynthesis C-methylase UbiE
VLAVAWLLHGPGLAAKQKAPTTETVSGAVTDKAENRISGATVTLKDLQTGKTVAIYTEANGQYQFSDLDPHHDYQIQASFQGVASETRQVSSLDTRRKLVINLTISTGQNKDQAVADKLATLLNWEPGSVVADIGAGEGRLTLAAAQRVGSSGHVFTTELDPRLLVNLEGLAARQKVQNITVIKAGEAQTNLPRECCDSIFMRHVYHHFRQPAQEDASLFQSLKPGGILAVIDFQPSQDASTLESGNEDVPSNRGGHGVTKQALIEELSAAGFQVVTTPTDWPGEDYCVVFRKPPQ